MQSPLIALIAGEDSGDQLGAELIAALRRRYPQARFVGIGGARMQREGFESWYDIRELSVMGFAEVLRHLPRLLRLRKALLGRLLEARPDVVVGIDAPDFNLAVERRLREAGLRTVHYVSPSVWAWREKRAEKIGLSADRVLCLFPTRGRARVHLAGARWAVLCGRARRTAAVTDVLGDVTCAHCLAVLARHQRDEQAKTRRAAA